MLIADFVRDRMPVAAVPGIPSIRLHMAAPASGVGRLGTDGKPPYWAYHWGGGLALARYILEHPGCVKGRAVLDLGAGSGLVGIAAALAGAASVAAIDVDAAAVAAIPLNAMLNGVVLTVHQEDILDRPPPDGVFLLLVGDLFYDPTLALRVARFLDSCIDAGIMVLVGDPYRASLPRDRLILLAEYDVSETGGQPRPSGVFRYCGTALASPTYP